MDKTYLYHIINRGVDGRTIFLDSQDYLRFIHNLFEFNDEAPVQAFYRFRKFNDLAGRQIERKPRKLLVQIHAFALMPNHFHLLLSPLIDGGTVRFMSKLDMGYAKYFNEKYERKGTLFMSRYKSMVVEQEAHFIHLPYYIHCNPLDLRYGEWRERKLANPAAAIKFLETYRWSSHLDYLGKKNFPSVTDREFLLNYFRGVDGYAQRMYSWLKGMDLKNISGVMLE